MGKKNVQLNKVFLYGAALSIGFMTILAGDSVRSMPIVAAPPPKVPVIAINPDDWQSLATAVGKRADSFGGTVGYIIKDFHSGQTASVNSELAFPSASLIKFPILCAAFQAIQEGLFSLNTPITLQRGDKRPGSGVLKLNPIGTVYTNRELLEFMIGHSDNTAAELLIRQLGYDYLQKTFIKLGLQDTAIHREGFQLSARHVDEDNMTSPRDMAFLLEKIYKRELVSPEASDQMLDILKHQHLRDRLPKFLPTGWEIAHKTGLLRKSCHDVGIVFSPKGDYMICVLTSHDATYKNAKRFIASMARITFDYYGRHDAPHVTGSPSLPMISRNGNSATSPRSS